MKRITYISRFAERVDREQIRKLEEVAQRNNERHGITGVLICSGGLFYQIIEGEDDNIDQLYQNIVKDHRHVDIRCLKVEYNVQEREFPHWSMKSLNLDEANDVLMRPIRTLLQVLTESYGILEKYTQPGVLKLVNQGINPLEVRPRRVEKIVLFCDIVAFSQFSAVLSAEETMALVNKFFTACTSLITVRGGEVTKLMGDCLMAYFSREQAEEAMQSALDILAALEEIRANASPDSPQKVLFCGMGLAFGEVIEGNIGSPEKMDYTVLGDSVNKAAYLEALTRRLSRSLAFSTSVRNIISKKWKTVHEGDFPVLPNQDPTPVFSIDTPLTQKPFDSGQMMQHIKRGLETLRAAKSAVGRE